MVYRNSNFKHGIALKAEFIVVLHCYTMNAKEISVAEKAQCVVAIKSHAVMVSRVGKIAL